MGLHALEGRQVIDRIHARAGGLGERGIAQVASPELDVPRQLASAVRWHEVDQPQRLASSEEKRREARAEEARVPGDQAQHEATRPCRALGERVSSVRRSGASRPRKRVSMPASTSSTVIVRMHTGSTQRLTFRL